MRGWGTKRAARAYTLEQAGPTLVESQCLRNINCRLGVVKNIVPFWTPVPPFKGATKIPSIHFALRVDSLKARSPTAQTYCQHRGPKKMWLPLGFPPTKVK